MRTLLQSMSLLCLFMTLSGCSERVNQLDLTQPVFGAVAHAGGGINKKPYTNSLEAMDHNYDLGFRLFELDFSWTTDGHLVCLHDWDRTSKWLLGYSGEQPLSLGELKHVVKRNNGLTPCDLTSLNQWMQDHPDAFMITDIKGNNIEGLNLIIKQIKNAQARVIPQFVHSGQYEVVKSMGFAHLIWTLYSYKGDNDELIKDLAPMQLFAVTMPPQRAKTNVARQLARLGIPTYVHTINQPEEADVYIQTHGLTSVYTDFLGPQTISENLP